MDWLISSIIPRIPNILYITIAIFILVHIFGYEKIAFATDWFIICIIVLGLICIVTDYNVLIKDDWTMKLGFLIATIIAYLWILIGDLNLPRVRDTFNLLKSKDALNKRSYDIKKLYKNLFKKYGIRKWDFFSYYIRFRDRMKFLIGIIWYCIFFTYLFKMCNENELIDNQCIYFILFLTISYILLEVDFIKTTFHQEYMRKKQSKLKSMRDFLIQVKHMQKRKIDIRTIIKCSSINYEKSVQERLNKALNSNNDDLQEKERVYLEILKIVTFDIRSTALIAMAHELVSEAYNKSNYNDCKKYHSIMQNLSTESQEYIEVKEPLGYKLMNLFNKNNKTLK